VVPTPGAAPGPVLGPAVGGRPHQPGAQRVAFDVTADGEQVLAVLDGEGFVGALVEVASALGVVVGVPPPDVGGGQAVHVPAQVAGVMRPQHQVPVVGHEAVGEQAHGHVRVGLGHGALEGVVVRRLGEQLAAGVASVDDMEDHPARLNPRRAWHARRLIPPPPRVNNVLIPFFPNQCCTDL